MRPRAGRTASINDSKRINFIHVRNNASLHFSMCLDRLRGETVRSFGHIFTPMMHALACSVLLLTLLARSAFAQGSTWPQLCPDQEAFSAWNQTRCPASATCAPNAFSVTGWGCSPFANATICNEYQTCPSGSTCTLISGTSYSEVYECTGAARTSLCTCKPGMPLPLDPVRKNVLIIGDSLTIGYTPVVASLLVRLLPRFVFWMVLFFPYQAQPQRVAQLICFGI